MSLPLYIDVTTGEARVSLAGPIRQRMKFFLNDLAPLAIAFVQNGAVITSTFLEAGSSTMKVGIRAKPGQGSILAEVTSYTYGTPESTVILPLDATALSDYFTANIPAGQKEAEFHLEVQVTNQSGSARMTVYQSPCLIGREVNV